jgi:thioredoxin-dependent peroxiredoxin
MPIVVNQAVPEFSSTDQHGQVVSNTSLKGKAYVLFFYGQDDTPTCTKQVCSTDASFAALAALGYTVFGVSPDTVKKHQKFIEKYGLKINLLSDPEKTMMFAFDAYGPKVFMGKDVIGVYRRAYVVNAEGTVVAAVMDVTSAIQGQQILDAIKGI